MKRIRGSTGRGAAESGARPALAALTFVLSAGGAAHLAFSWMGFVAMDEGYVLAASRRVLAGQIPYRDFIWIHGPGSPWLFAPLIPWGGEWTLWLSRGVCWLQFATIGWCWAGLVARVAGRVWSPAMHSTVAATAMAHAAHTFPPMAWFSVDAVWAASLGIALAVRAPGAMRLAGFALIGCTPLFRQNFVLLIPVAVVLLGGWRSAACWAAAAAPGVATGAWLIAAGAVVPALEQMGATPDFVRLAIHPFVYLQPEFPLAILAGFGAAWAATRAKRRAVRRAGRAALVVAVLVAGVLLARNEYARSSLTVFWTVAGALVALRPEAAARPWRAGAWLLGTSLVVFGLPPFHAAELPVYALAAWALYRLAVGGGWRRSPLGWPERLGLLALFVAWSVSISMGYNNPALGTAGLVAFLLAIACRPDRPRASGPRWPAVVAAIATLAAVGMARTRYVYFQPAARELRLPAGEVLAGARGIRTDIATHAFLADLTRAIAGAGGGCYVILPDLAAHWVRSQSLNPLPVDWAAGVEMRDPALLAPLLRDLDARRGRCLVIYQKFTAAYISGRPYPVTGGGYRVLTAHVRARYKKVGETDWFELYR